MRELVENSLDAAEAAGATPDIYIRLSADDDHEVDVLDRERLRVAMRRMSAPEKRALLDGTAALLRAAEATRRDTLGSAGSASQTRARPVAESPPRAEATHPRGTTVRQKRKPKGVQP